MIPRHSQKSKNPFCFEIGRQEKNQAVLYYPVFTIIFLLFPDSVDGCYDVCSFILHTPTDRDQKNMKYRHLLCISGLP